MKSQKNNPSKKALESYWTNRYLNKSTGWDLGNISEPIKLYIDQLAIKNLKILIPGAGNGYEVEYLYRMGFKNVFILDISEIPLANFKKRMPDFPNHQIIKGDFFTYQNTFDLIIEQTFFCSFPPINNTREKYVKKMYNLLNPNGKLVGLWFNMPFSGDYTKRPFGATKPEYKKLFSKYFKINILEESYNSAEARLGQELFGILEKPQ